MRGAPIAILVAALAAGLAAEQTGAIRLPGRVEAVHAEDADGDGQLDLLVVGSGRLRVYRGAGGGKLGSRRPALDAAFPEECPVYDLGDLDGDGALELAALHSKGVDAYELALAEDGTLQRWAQPLVPTTTVFRGGIAESPVRRRFLLDLRGEGVLDCLIPTSRLLYVCRGDGKGLFKSPRTVGFERDGRLRIERPWSPSSGQDPTAVFSASVRIPRIDSGQAGGPGDGHDLFVIDGDDLRVHLRGADGRLPEKNSNPSFVFRVPDPERDGRRRMRLVRLPLLLGDTNADGLTDVIVADTAGGRVALHRQSASGWVEKPDDVLTVPGWIVGAQLEDMNGDGRDDLVLVRIDEVGIWDAISIVTSKKLPVEISLYLAGDDGVFPSRPAFHEATDIPILIGGEGLRTITFEAGFMPTAGGDHDGDGVKDLVLLGKRDSLRILGRKSGGSKWGQIGQASVPGLSSFRRSEAIAADLDGDGTDEIVLLCHTWDEADGDEIRLLRTK